MTIKRRLYISNILMIIVPIFVSILALIAGVAFTFHMVTKQNTAIYEKFKYEELQSELSENAEKIFAGDENSKKALAQMESILKENDAQVNMYLDGKPFLKIGNSDKEKGVTSLVKTMLKTGGQGTVTVDDTDLVFETFKEQGHEYTMCLISPRYDVLFAQYKHIGLTVLFVVSVVVIIVVFLTCYFLSRFILRKIERPLDILMAGVGQIRDGNLDYRIQYEGRDEFAPVCNDFNEMAERLKTSVEDTQRQEENRKELLAGISHDLRTPLTSINAYLDGILDDVADTPEKRNKYIATIKKKALEINKMVDQLFLFSKLDLGEYPFYLETLDVGKELNEMIESNAVEYREKGLEIEINEIKPDLSVYGDAVQLRNVFNNIFSNSLKYKDKEDGHLLVSCSRVDDEVIIQMEDDGPGVPAEDVEKLFDTFYRCDPSRKDSGKGSGLGLAICVKTMERMNGTITAENIKEGGLRVIIKLPIYKGENK